MTNINYTDYIIKSIYVIVLSTALYFATTSIVDCITPIINNLHQNKMEMLALQEKINQMKNNIKATKDYTLDFTQSVMSQNNNNNNFFSWMNNLTGSYATKIYYLLVIIKYLIPFIPTKKVPILSSIAGLIKISSSEEILSQETLREALVDIQQMKLQLLQFQAHWEQLRRANEILGTAVTNLESLAANITLNSLNAQNSQNNFESALRELSNLPAFLGSGSSIPVFDSSHLFEDDDA